VDPFRGCPKLLTLTPLILGDFVMQPDKGPTPRKMPWGFLNTVGLINIQFFANVKEDIVLYYRG